ncbi:sugar phosphate nucleotidyltransferase [Gorillibacterium sp. sgz5001074]|uniref:sugar phosphate nucleotidyltransferase n=1 Tax=Gorillibacterium sp. sgz5001074 TaxID=3446695 RepID=UPI003F673C24
MKGILIAGGKGTRLDPLTRYINKHLLPVGRLPMILHNVRKLERAGIRDIRIITGRASAGLFMQLLGSGSEWNVRLTYGIQDDAGGIAQALGLAEDFIRPGEACVVLLGDNLFESELAPYIRKFQASPGHAMVLLKEVQDPRRYGVPVFDGEVLKCIEEKPEAPRSSYAVTGIYLYDYTVFEAVRQIKPSARGELEITDVNNLMAAASKLDYDMLEGWWKDAGTFESLHEASELLLGDPDD